jgi:hypothetical protein
MVTAAAGAVLAAGVVLLSRLPVLLSIGAHVRDWDAELSLSVHYGRLRLAHRWQLPVRPPSNQLPSRTHSAHVSWTLLQRALRALFRMENLVGRLWARMVVRDFNLTVSLGLGDAAATALWTGRAALAASWWIASRIAPRAHCTPYFKVSPNWDQPSVFCDFTSIIQLRPSDIILAALASLSYKGGRQDGRAAVDSTVNGPPD